MNYAVTSYDLKSYATSLNVSWYYPTIVPAEVVLIGDGGQAISSYLIEWAKVEFNQMRKTTQEIVICVNNTLPEQYFSLSLTTNNAHNYYSDSQSYHSSEFPIIGTYYSANIFVNSTAFQLKKILENMPNVAEVHVVRTTTPTQITYLVTFTESANVPLFGVLDSTITCDFIATPLVINAVSNVNNTASYSWQTVPANRLSVLQDNSEQYYLIQNLTPGSNYYVQISASNDLGYGQRMLTAPSVLATPITPPTSPTQLQGDWSLPKLYLATPTSLLLSVGPPVFDGGSLVGVYIIEWDESSQFNSGLSGQAYGMATVPAYTQLCTSCVHSIEFAYNAVDPTVLVGYAGNSDIAQQLMAGGRVAIVTKDDGVAYTFVVADHQANTTSFEVANTGNCFLTCFFVLHNVFMYAYDNCTYR